MRLATSTFRLLRDEQGRGYPRLSSALLPSAFDMCPICVPESGKPRKLRGLESDVRSAFPSTAR